MNQYLIKLIPIHLDMHIHGLVQPMVDKAIVDQISHDYLSYYGFTFLILAYFVHYYDTFKILFIISIFILYGWE